LEDIDNLTRRYICEQLVFLPGGTRQFDTHVVAAHQTLRAIFLHNMLPINHLPSALYTKIRDTVSDKAKKHVQNMKENQIKTMLTDLRAENIGNLPNESSPEVANIHACRSWDYTNYDNTNPNQPVKSKEEQKDALNMVSKQLDNYQSTSSFMKKNIVIECGPGVGKTTVLKMIAIMVLCKQLSTCMSATLGTVLS
jgi:hypothetical protein